MPNSVSTANVVGAMSRRDRRRLGFTRRNVIQSARKLARNGELAGLDDEDIKDAIAADIVSENIGAWGEVIGDQDWGGFFDSLIAFIEKILPLIMKILALFGL